MTALVSGRSPLPVMMWLVLASLLGAASCGSDTADDPPVVRRDSVGLEIVTSAKPEWGEESGWLLATEPDVAIGAAEGDERYLLDNVVMVRRAANGRIIVLEGGQNRVRVYDQKGTHLVDMGGRGEGPSEFRFPQYLSLRNDSIGVYDAVTGRIAWFDSSGRFLGGETPAPDPGGNRSPGWVVGEINGGEYVVTAPTRAGVRRGEGRMQPPMLLRTFSLGTGTKSDSLLSYAGREQIWFEDGDRLARQDVLWGANTYVDAAGDRIVMGESSAYSLRFVDASGATRLLARRPVAATAVTDAAIDEFVDATVGGSGLEPGARDAFERSIRDRALADSFPHLRFIVIDSERNAWVENWAPADSPTASFSVFAPTGEWRGDVALPAGLPELRGVRTKPLEIGPDYVLGVWRSELGVQQVRLYRLLKD